MNSSSNTKKGGKRQVNEDRKLFSTLVDKNRSGNIVIKSLSEDKESSKLQKSMRQLDSQIEQLDQEHNRLKMLRDENNNKVKVLFNQSNEARDKRNSINELVKETKNQRKTLIQEKQKLIQKKRDTGILLNETEDKENKSRIYQEFIELREQLGRTIEELNEVDKRYQNVIAEGQSEHQNMIAYKKMAEQTRKVANDYHNQMIEKRKELSKLRSKKWALNRKIREANG